MHELNELHGGTHDLDEYLQKIHAAIGRDDVSLEQVRSADTYSSGSIDYLSKFSLHCWELHKYGKIP